MTLDKKGLENSGYMMPVNVVEAVTRQSPCQIHQSRYRDGLNDTLSQEAAR
jgi:hypothetical protein